VWRQHEYQEAVGFEQEELLELEMILVDGDAQAALEFSSALYG